MRTPRTARARCPQPPRTFGSRWSHLPRDLTCRVRQARFRPSCAAHELDELPPVGFYWAVGICQSVFALDQEYQAQQRGTLGRSGLFATIHHLGLT